MPNPTVPLTLIECLEHVCARIRKQQGEVLFRRGEKAFGIFLVFSGTVDLDLENGTAGSYVRSYGAGALVGLPSAVTKNNYSMTATVAADAQVGFLSVTDFDALLRMRPELCSELLVILSNEITYSREVIKGLMSTSVSSAGAC